MFIDMTGSANEIDEFVRHVLLFVRLNKNAKLCSN